MTQHAELTAGHENAKEVSESGAAKIKQSNLSESVWNEMIDRRRSTQATLSNSNAKIEGPETKSAKPLPHSVEKFDPDITDRNRMQQLSRGETEERPAPSQSDIAQKFAKKTQQSQKVEEEQKSRR